MRNCDPALPARRTKASEPRRSDRIALLFALVIALIVGIASTAIGLEIYAGRQAEVKAASRAGVRAVGLSVAQTVERAVGFGIPIDRLYRADAYLNQSMRANGEISAIEIRDATGRAVAHSGEKPDVRPVMVPITDDGNSIGSVWLYPSYAIALETRATIVQMAVVVTVLAGLAAGILMRALLTEAIDLRQARMVGIARSVARGRFSDDSALPADSPYSALATAAAGQLNAVRAEARAVATLAEEIRAVDFDGTLAPRVSAAVTPLGTMSAFTVVPRHRFNARWQGWWALVTLALAGATRPLLASFAADRVDPGLLQTLLVACSVGLDMAGRLIGLLAALLVVRGRPAAVASALAVAAGALIWVSESHGVGPVLATRFLSGFGFWFAAWSLIALDGRFLRQPFRWALLLLAAEGVGPVIGLLSDQMAGRRTMLEVAGLAAGVLALLALALRTRSTAPFRLCLRVGDAGVLTLLAFTIAAAMAFMEGELAGGPARADLAYVSLGFALFGAGAAIMPLIRPARWITAAVAAAALLVACSLAGLGHPAPLPWAATPLGLALGASATLAAGRTFTIAGGLALAAGCALAALSLAAIALAGLPPAMALLAPAAGALVVLLAGALRLRRHPGKRGA